MNEQLWWYVARAAGLTAWGLCTLAVLWGLALSTRLLGKRPAPGWLLDLHRFLGGLATVFVAVHLAGLVADSYLHFGPTDLVVPMASDWRPGPVAWGVVALYLLVAVELTSIFRRRLPARLWRTTHAGSLPLWLAGTIHTLAAGTDASHPVVQWAALASGALVAFAALVRVLSPRAARAGRPAPASPDAPEGPATPDAPPPAPAAPPASPPESPARPSPEVSDTRDRSDARARAAAARAALAARRAPAPAPTDDPG